jgi:hypothetical protein
MAVNFTETVYTPAFVAVPKTKTHTAFKNLQTEVKIR